MIIECYIVAIVTGAKIRPMRKFVRPSAAYEYRDKLAESKRVPTLVLRPGDDIARLERNL